MALPESNEKAYLPGDQVDATELNALQYGITANHARIERLAAPELQWLIGKTIGDVTFAADGVATIDGMARVFIDCRVGPIREIRVHCRVDADGVDFEVMNGATVIVTASHVGDGIAWKLVTITVVGYHVTTETRLSLSIVTSQPQSVDRLALTLGSGS